MKNFLLVLLAVILTSSFALAQVDDSVARSMFENFMTQFDRNYPSSQEKEARFQIFQQNLLRAKQLQAIQKGSAVYGFNKFSDLTQDEFRSTHLLRKFPSATVCKWPYSRYLVNFDQLTQTVSAPSSFDWRTKGAVTAVKDQESCGSCWAFSTVANIEGQMYLSTKNLTSYSEQQIVDCSHACLQSESYLCNAGCGGGLPWLAYEDIMKWSKGLVYETSYPYVGFDEACQSVTVAAPGHISNWTAVPTTVSVINAFLVSNGPLSITLNADLLFSYTKGVINTDPSQCDPEGADHAVTLVGFGVDESTKTNYWIVKNSWGEDWGEEGYFRIASDQGLCGINACVTSSLIKK